ncbi:MAG: knotted carbamoyltransferase YgeW [Planctomycetota bacterium]|nr:MAG: knotted carbamoyltransferase YgeW [Planctomycetota bacterium]
MPESKQAAGALIQRLADIPGDLVNRDFLLTWKHSLDELRAVLLAAEALHVLWCAGRSTRVFEGGLAVSNFRDKSTRTRFSYASAASMLGLSCQDLDETKSQIAHGETVRETANMIAFATETIGIRDDMYLGEGHKYMAEVAAAVDEGFREGVLPQRPAVINLQCDLDHPTQSLADLLHLQQTFGGLEALRGKRLAMTWAYSPSYGKPLSVPQGIITLMTRFGMNVVLAHPEGYDLVPETLEAARRFASESGGSFEITHRMDDAFADADIVYPKSWAPVAVMQRRTELLRGGRAAELDALEQECLANNARFQDWQCDAQRMATTRDGAALYMHCLPADITGVSCERGEVTADVFERYRLATYREAGYKPFVIAAMMLLTRFDRPSEVLERCLRSGRMRRG